MAYQEHEDSKALIVEGILLLNHQLREDVTQAVQDGRCDSLGQHLEHNHQELGISNSSIFHQQHADGPCNMQSGSGLPMGIISSHHFLDSLRIK